MSEYLVSPFWGPIILSHSHIPMFTVDDRDPDSKAWHCNFASLLSPDISRLSIKAEALLRAFLGHRDVLAVGEVVHGHP